MTCDNDLVCKVVYEWKMHVKKNYVKEGVKRKTKKKIGILSIQNFHMIHILTNIII